MKAAAKPRVVFIAAMQREIAGVVSGWCGDEELPARRIHLYWNDDAVIACAGMGADRARLAVEAALALGPAAGLISVGWAGACNSVLRAGDVVHASTVVDTRTGERFFSVDQGSQQTVVTVAVPAGAREKQRLGASYSAAAVDMEAAAVARMAQARDLPFRAIKAISDEADFELPELSRFTTADGQFREGAFAFHVVTHPALWKPVATMARSSKLAAGRLQSEIRAVIEQHRKISS